MLETSGPVPAFMNALQARDLNRAAGLLAADAELVIPPLHLSWYGLHEVMGAVVELLRGFGELRYDLGSRYLAPGQVTDEAVVVGRQTGSFLGEPPSRRVSAVGVRIIVTHDAASVRSLQVWPDLATLPTAVAGASRLIDLRRVSQAGGVVAALRATLPPSQTKVILGTSRESSVIPIDAPLPSFPGEQPPDRLALKPSPRLPVPKAVRRRRTLIAGTSMLAASTAITVWIALGAWNITSGAERAASAGNGVRTSSTAAAAPSPGSASEPGADGPGPAAGRMPGGATATSEDAAPTRVPIVNDQAMVPADLLFDTDSATLTPEASTILRNLIIDATQEGRTGRVTVHGHTDDTGSTSHNAALSRKRAQAVAAVLKAGLAGQGMTFVATGHGSADPIDSNDTEEGRHHNRRVTIVFTPVDD